MLGRGIGGELRACLSIELKACLSIESSEATGNEGRSDRVRFVMRIDPIKHTAIKFPAPVCRDCSIPMITVTSIFRHATPDEEKIVSYECQKCGCTLGPARDRRGRQYFVSPLSGFTHPA